MSSQTNDNIVFVDKLKELKDVQFAKSKVLAAIYTRENNEIIKYKIDELDRSISSSAGYYGENISKYADAKDKILQNFEIALRDIIKEYDIQYMSIQSKVRETETNQQIALMNARSGNNIDENLLKFEMYEILLSECNKSIEELKDRRAEEFMNISLGSTGELSIASSNVNIISKVINKILGTLRLNSNKFKTKVIDNFREQIDIFNNQKNDKISSLREETIDIVTGILAVNDIINLDCGMAS